MFHFYHLYVNLNLFLLLNLEWVFPRGTEKNVMLLKILKNKSKNLHNHWIHAWVKFVSHHVALAKLYNYPGNLFTCWLISSSGKLIKPNTHSHRCHRPPHNHLREWFMITRSKIHCLSHPSGAASSKIVYLIISSGAITPSTARYLSAEWSCKQPRALCFNSLVKSNIRVGASYWCGNVANTRHEDTF